MENQIKNAVLVESEVLAHDTIALVTLIDNAGGYASPMCDSITMELNNRSTTKMSCAGAFNQNINSSEFDIKPKRLHVAETAFSDFNTNAGEGQFVSFAYYPKQTLIAELGDYNGKPVKTVNQRLIIAVAAGKSMWPDQSDFQIQGVLGCFPEADFDPDVPDGMVATVLNGYFSALFGHSDASSNLAANYYSFSSGWINHHGVADYNLSALYKGNDRERIRISMSGGPSRISNTSFPKLFTDQGEKVSRIAAA